MKDKLIEEPLFSWKISFIHSSLLSFASLIEQRALHRISSSSALKWKIKNIKFRSLRHALPFHSGTLSRSLLLNFFSLFLLFNMQFRFKTLNNISSSFSFHNSSSSWSLITIQDGKAPLSNWCVRAAVWRGISFLGLRFKSSWAMLLDDVYAG